MMMAARYVKDEDLERAIEEGIEAFSGALLYYLAYTEIRQGSIEEILLLESLGMNASRLTGLLLKFEKSGRDGWNGG